MNKIFEIYTDSKTINIEEINQFVQEVNTESCGFSFEEIARLVYQNENGINTLVECQIPTKDGLECGLEGVELVAYEYDGKLEDYSADREVMCKTFNLDWNTLEEQMLEMAMSE